MLPIQVTVVLLAFAAASLFLALTLGSAAIASYHLVFTVGIVPLILSAMVYFIPVLTRSKSPGRFITALPFAALIGGLLVTSYFAFPFIFTKNIWHGQYIAAVIVMTTVAILCYWAYKLGAHTIGKPHPCLNWYLAALSCLLVALSAILMIYFFPGQRTALRLFHIHLNTLGFIGITALSTLQVLLPTVARRPDSAVGVRMLRHLKLVVTGTVLIAFGAAWQPVIAWAGLAILLIPVFDIARSWVRLYDREVFTLHGAAPALAAALAGYMVMLILGAAHVTRYSHINPVAVFIIAFLMPLVTGAISHLLPLWLKPGQQISWHEVARKSLGFGGGLRGLIFLSGGILAGLGYKIGWIMAAITVSLFFIQVTLVFIMARPTSCPLRCLLHHLLPSTVERRDNTENPPAQ